MTTGAFGAIARYLVAAWLGAVVLFAAVVAPAAFAVLPTRALAGALVGRVLPVLFLAGMAVGILVLIAAWRVAPGARRMAGIVAGAALVASCAVAQFVIGARIERVRAEAGVALDELPSGHPVRVTFGRLHGLSVVGLGVAAIGAAAALVLLGPGGTTRRARSS